MKLEALAGLVLALTAAFAFAAGYHISVKPSTSDIITTDASTEPTTAPGYTTTTQMGTGAQSKGSGRGPGPHMEGSGLAYNLTEEGAESLLYMWQEEKLARDVYMKLYEMYGLQIFKNISESEIRHMAAVAALISKYGLNNTGPVEPGVFSYPELQELYNALIENASRGLVDAVLAGAFIEEKDIVDLKEIISKIDNPDFKKVYENLLKGSAHHLAAFAREYEALTGEAYTPQILDQSDTVRGSGLGL